MTNIFILSKDILFVRVYRKCHKNKKISEMWNSAYNFSLQVDARRQQEKTMAKTKVAFILGTEGNCKQEDPQDSLYTFYAVCGERYIVPPTETTFCS